MLLYTGHRIYQSYELLKNKCRELEKDYENIKLVELEENSGLPGKPRSLGIEYASSDYIIFLDSDDTYEKEAFEILYATITKTNSDFVISSHFINLDGERIKANLIQTEEEIIVCDDGFAEHIIIDDKEDLEYAQIYQELDCDNCEVYNYFTDEVLNPDYRLIYFGLMEVNSYGRVLVNVNKDDLSSNTDSANLRVGIIEPNRVIRYIEGKDIITHTFILSQTGEYKVFIENRGPESVSIGATVTYRPREED